MGLQYVVKKMYCIEITGVHRLFSANIIITNIIFLNIKDYRVRNTFISFSSDENNIETLPRIDSTDSEYHECFMRVIFVHIRICILDRCE